MKLGTEDIKLADSKNKRTTRKIDLMNGIITVISSILVFGYGAYQSQMGHEISHSIEIILILSALVQVFLLIFRNFLKNKEEFTVQDYSREAKKNQWNTAVFNSLYDANENKIRAVLRNTYGNISVWNPINYKKNVLTYDVHEQIRIILTSIEKTIIGIDPIRFNDNNVSVELIYSYPQDIDNVEERPEYIEIPIRRTTYKDNESNEEKMIWKLISSGDMSGNQKTVSSYLENWKSFYTLVDCCGTVILNNKFLPLFNEKQMSFIEKRSKNRSPFEGKDINPDAVFYQSDVKDLEHSKDGVLDGTAIGTVISIRNDAPEAVFVKAILTINTYGEAIFKAQTNNNEKSSYKGKTEKRKDCYGLTKDDYYELIDKTILKTYTKLLEVELSQMYIRHEIKRGRKCPITGAAIKQKSGCRSGVNKNQSDRDTSITQNEECMICTCSCDGCRKSLCI